MSPHDFSNLREPEALRDLSSMPASGRVPAGPGSSEERWVALDLFRAIAVLWMIQGHTFTAMLDVSLYQGPWAQVYSLLHGLTAPMFLIGAGLSYGVVTFAAVGRADTQAARDREWLRGRERGRRIVRRAWLLLAIGTLLQLPRTSLYEVFTRRDLFIGSFQPGALQLVASGLLMAEGLRRLLRTRERFAIVAGTFAVVIGLAAPWIWNLRSSQHFALGSWVDGQAGAQFPLAPWLCFFFVGTAIAAAFGRSLWRQESGSPMAGTGIARELSTGARMSRVGVAGFAISVVCYVMFLSGVRLTSIYGEHVFWYTSPLFVAFRAGLACAWLGVLTTIESRLARTFAALPRLARPIRALAKHSLVAYVVHLILLYGTPWNAGLARSGPHLGWLETTAAFACVLATTVAVTLAWDHWQASGGLKARLARRAA